MAAEETTSMTNKATLEDLADQLEGQRVLMRVDFNVPMDNGVITDSFRIDSAIPSIELAINNRAKCVVLMSHLGRPGGIKDPKLSLEPVAECLASKTQKSVRFLPECYGPEVLDAVNQASDGQIILLENLRFNIGETGKGKNAAGEKIKATQAQKDELCAGLTELCDVYINDAFGTAHRAHSSMVGVDCEYKAGGLLIKKELESFARVLEAPEKPLLAILGGAKVSDKMKLIFNLLDKVDKMIIGGGMAFSFLKVRDQMEIGNSLYEEAAEELVPNILEKAKEKNVEIILPTDFVCADEFSKDANVQTVTREYGVPEGWMGLDCGPQSEAEFAEAIRTSKTIIWNGPPGVFEFEKFESSTRAMLDAIIEATENGCVSVIGGGDTGSAVTKFGGAGKVTHISTGGGASLELLEGKSLPGIANLSEK